MADTGGYYIGYNPNPIYNYRVQRWKLSGSVAGTTVAGSTGSESSLNQIGTVYNIHVDANGVLYVADATNHRVTKWILNAITGILVAGDKNGTSGSTLTMLNGPQGVSTDKIGNIFVSDTGNHRVVRWASGGTTGVVVAGGTGQGSSNSQLNSPTSIIVDGNGNLFVLDSGNQRIQLWSPDATYGIIVFDGSYNNAVSSGSLGMAMDASGNLYVTDYSGKRVHMIPISSPTTTASLSCTTAIYSNTVTTVAYDPSYGFYGVAVDSNNNVYASNSAAQVYKYQYSSNYTDGIRIAPTTAPNVPYYYSTPGGNTASQIGTVYGLFVERLSNNLYMADTGSYNYYSSLSQQNYRIQRWGLNGSVFGTTMAGGAGSGLAPNQIGTVFNIYVDTNGVLYVPDATYHRVTKWTLSAAAGVVVAGSWYGATGSSLALLNGPQGIWVDNSGNVYVSDTGNHRVVRWARGATTGVLVAGGNGQGPYSVQLNYPTSIIIDGNGNLFIFDSGNQRIQQWPPGATYGITIFDGSYNNAVSIGSFGMVMDTSGNLYVTDFGGRRVQMISMISTSVCGTTRSPFVCTAATYSNTVTTVAYDTSYGFYGVAVDSNNNVYASNSAAQVYKYQYGSNSTDGIRIAPTTAPNVPNYYSTPGGNTASQIGTVYGLFVERLSNNLYMADTGSYNYYSSL
ncbi:unnamed protein product, partial [Rotaria sp. Silwood2]